jgi:hypothetical protein
MYPFYAERRPEAEQRRLDSDKKTKGAPSGPGPLTEPASWALDRYGLLAARPRVVGLLGD